MSNALNENQMICDKSYFNTIHYENQNLKLENQNLKLKLFWKDYNLNNLKQAMCFANSMSGTGPQCVCFSCGITGRKENDDDEDEPIIDSDDCTFKPWFEQQLKSLQMTVQISLQENRNDTHICLSGNTDFRSCNASVYDDDSHFAHFSSKHDWNWFTYGSKIWEATSVEDPELEKLKNLFTLLNKDAYEEEEDN